MINHNNEENIYEICTNHIIEIFIFEYKLIKHILHYYYHLTPYLLIMHLLDETTIKGTIWIVIIVVFSYFKLA
jgi:hypothetical protein